MYESNAAIDVGFLYLSGRDHPDIGDAMKCGLLFFDQLALKTETVDYHNANYTIEPLRERGLLEVVTPEEIMTPDALELQNDILLSLVREGIFDYLGDDPSYDFFISPRPLRYVEYAQGEHRAFLTPVGEELVRRKLAMPYRARIPEELRRQYEQSHMEVDGDHWRYERLTGSDSSVDFPSTMTNPYKAFPLGDGSWRRRHDDSQPMEFDGRTFIQL
jgi:hypothetical protein